MLRARWRSVVLLMGVLCGVVRADAAVRALLIGVSEYPTLDAKYQLASGPRNDVRAFEQYLDRRGVPSAAITVLTEGATAGLPTRQAILEHLAALLAATQTGDTVVLYFAGHGSQQPSRDDSRTEPDGLDEILLPRDVGAWSGGRGTVVNSIVDNEVGVLLAKFRDKGAFVWAIFDTCHSESLTRGSIGLRTQDRSVPPARLGIPAADLQRARRRALDRAAAAAAQGSRPAAPPADYVVFYAAQRAEATKQQRLPEDIPDAPWHGVFSYRLLEALHRFPHATYRQILDVIHERYLGLNMTEATPGLEGPGADRQPLSELPTAPIEQWAARRDGSEWRVDAGELQGVTPDSVLAVFASPVESDSDLIDYIRIGSATATAATGMPVAYRGRAPAATVQTTAGFARPVELKVDFTLRVGVIRTAKGCEPPGPALSAALEHVQRGNPGSPSLAWIPDSGNADVWLCQDHGRVRFLDTSADVLPSDVAQPHALPLPTSADAAGNFAAQLAETLEAIGRVVNIFRIAAAQTPIATPIRITAQRCDGNSRDSAESDAAPHYSVCDAELTPMDPPARRHVRDGDVLLVHFRNESYQNVDVTLLFVGADYSIKTLFPEHGSEEDVRIPLQSEIMTIAVKASTRMPVNDRLLLIAVPATPLSDRVSFESLSQPGPSAWRGAPLPRNRIAASLAAAVNGDAAGVAVNVARSPAQFTVFSWTVEP